MKNNKLVDENKDLAASVKALKHSNLSLKSTLQDTEIKLNGVKKEFEKLSENKNKMNKENQALRVNLEEKKISEKADMENYDDQIKMKNQEIKSLILTRKICVENATKLQQVNQQLEKEIEELKLKKTAPNKESKLPYPCDKCDFTFKTAGLLIRHVKSDHENMPVFRP